MLRTGLCLLALLALGCSAAPAETSPPTDRPTVSSPTIQPPATDTPSPQSATPTPTDTPTAEPNTPAPTSAEPTSTATATAPPTPVPVETPASTPSPTPSDAPAFTPSPIPGQDLFSAVWQDPGGGCNYIDATTVVAPDGVKIYIVGWCADDEGSTAMAWESDDGFMWERVLSRETNAQATGASTDGLSAAVFVGQRDEAVPLVWEFDRSADEFVVDELPADDGIATWADQVARGLNSFMIVGNEYPDGLEGDTRPVAWLKVVDETGWVMVEPPAEAVEFVDVADSSVFGEGATGSAVALAQRQFVGDRYSVIGWTSDFEPAIWNYTLDGTWARTLLPNDANEDLIREMTGFSAALADHTFWTLNGGEWSGVDLTSFVSSATAAVLLDFGEASGYVASGWQWDADGNGYVIFMRSLDGVEWSALPDQPQYHEFFPVSALAALEDHVVGVSEQQVYVGPITEP